MHVCVRGCVGACMHACVCACVRVCMRVCVAACVGACVGVADALSCQNQLNTTVGCSLYDILHPTMCTA